MFCPTQRPSCRRPDCFFRAAAWVAAVLSTYTESGNRFFFCLLLVLAGLVQPAQSQHITLVIDNQNTAIADPYVTFIQSLIANSTWDTNGFSSTALNGPALNATAGSTTLENGTSYPLSSLGTTPISLAPNWAGNIFFSDSDLSSVLGTSGQSPIQSPNPSSPPAFLIPAFNLATFYPTNPNGAITTNTQRYNYIELGGGSNSSINPDITYINYYSVPIQMTRSSDGSTRGAPSSQAGLDSLTANLASLSGNSSAVVVRANSDVTRVISPDNGAASQGPYPSFNSYISNQFSGGPGIPAINLQNTYSGVISPQDATFEQQNYSKLGTGVTYDGANLIIRGTSNNVGVGDFTMTAAVTPDQLSSAIYGAVLTYDVTWAQQLTPVSQNTGNNNVFSAVSRDLLAGFQLGFVGSTVVVGSTQIGVKTSQEWQQLSIANAFAIAQPSNAYYNTWAAEVNGVFPDVYSFPFNDFLTFAPELQVNTGETLTITLLNVNPVPEPSTIALAAIGLGVVTLAVRRRRTSR